MSITKESFRRICVEKMKRVPPNKVFLDAKVNARLQRTLRKIGGRKNILFYIPLRFEADIRKTLRIVRKKHNVFVPFMEGKSFKMVLYRLPLKKKRFGIYEAGNSHRNIKNLDIAIVPIVGLDKNMKRIGFGKGMYDRFFAGLRQKPYTIFIQRTLCMARESIGDTHDVSAHMLISADAWLEKRK